MSIKAAVNKRRGRTAHRHRVGRVFVYRRDRTWHLYYTENGKRVRRAAGQDLAAAKQLAAVANGVLVQRFFSPSYSVRGTSRHAAYLTSNGESDVG